MFNVEINGQQFESEPNSTIIEVADKAGIYIPRFCYHEKLSVAANCRMCLVEVERAPKPLPACATPVTDGMVVKTLSEVAKNAQEDTMEFLLIGPACFCPDPLPGLFQLPLDIGRGDHLEFGNIGAYSIGGRTDYNGFYSDRIALITSPAANPPTVP